MFEELQDFNYRHFIQTRRFLLLAVAAGLLAAILLLLVILPQGRDIFTLRQEKKQEEQRVAALRRKIVALDTSKTTTLFQKQDDINKLLPSKKAVFELLSSLKYISDQSGVRLSNLRFSPGLLATESATPKKNSAPPTRLESQAGVATMTLTFEAAGTRTNINRFLILVQQITPLSAVTQLDLNSRTSSPLAVLPEQRVFESTIALSTFYFTKSIPVTVDAELPTTSDDEEQVLQLLDTFLVAPFIPFNQITGGGNPDLFQTTGVLESL